MQKKTGISLTQQSKTRNRMQLNRILQHTQCPVFASTAGSHNFKIGANNDGCVRQLIGGHIGFVLVETFAERHMRNGSDIQNTVAHLEGEAGQLDGVL